MSKARSMQRAARRKNQKQVLTIGEKFCNWLDKVFKKGGSNE